MKTPHIRNAQLVSSEVLPKGDKTEVWLGSKGYYIYYRYPPPDLSLTLMAGPYKAEYYALRAASNLARSLIH